MTRMILLIALALTCFPVCATQVVVNQKPEEAPKTLPEGEKASPQDEPEEKPRKKQEQPKLSSLSQALSELVNAARDKQAQEDQERKSASKDPK